MTTPTTALRGSAALFLTAYLGAAFVPTLPEGAYDDARVAALLGGSDLGIAALAAADHPHDEPALGYEVEERRYGSLEAVGGSVAGVRHGVRGALDQLVGL